MRGLIVTAGILLTGAVALSQPIRSLFTSSEAAPMPALRVSRSTLAETAVAIGTVKPKVGAEVKVGSRISGVVTELNVEVGDRVKKGDRLASLEDEDWRARTDVLRAQLASAIAEQDYAAGELQRIERLGDLVPQFDADRAKTNVKVRQADVRRVRAAVAEAEISLRQTVIRAPVSGTIGSVSTYRGETIAASLASPTFVTIVDLDRLEVQTYVDETDIGRVREGQRVTFRVDAFPGRALEGVVEAIYPKAQLVNNVVNYIVIVGIAGGHGLPIRPEMTVHVTFVLDRREGVLAVPRSALLRKSGRTFLVVRRGDEWVERRVTTGMQTPQSIEITSGVAEGETILADRKFWKSGEA
ncbi:MAG TPA: efflux RND transporter periplasmic adaptor subunit [Thermoanaerobaculia bacterium]|nr:efflux RND transporter periplasmic adaptor subunit [Thermoanaerobaculia bacterium]